jgi:hypothetical protein
MKQLTLLFTVLAFVFTASAQQKGPHLSWDNNFHDFGEIKEEGGKVSYKFELTNTGSQPLVITHVKPSCGCTSSDWTKAPIAPGGKGYVSATYNPLRRPGSFNKSITITSNADPATTVVRFKGNVIPKPKTKQDLFPRTLGKLNLKSTHLTFSKVLNSQVKTEIVNIINLQQEPITLTFKNVPDHLTIKAVPETLKPEEEGVIEVTYTAEKKNDWGFLIDKVNLVINGEAVSSGRFTVSATVVEDFSKLSEVQLANAPVASFDNKAFNFGTLKEGEKANHTYKLTNNGKSDLVIRKIKSSCGCTVVKPQSKVIKPGETTELGVTFNSRGKKGKPRKHVTVITNDPKNSSIRLTISGEVQAIGQVKE